MCAIRLSSLQLLDECHFRFVLTSRFNQDIVENWFSCVRQKGLNNDSRTSWEYESAGKALTINWMLTTASKQANCEPDFDKYIGLASQINGSSGRTVSASTDQCESIQSIIIMHTEQY